MRVADLLLPFVVLGLVLSAAAMSNPLELWTALLSCLALSGSLIAFATWIRGRISRARCVLLNGAAALFAAFVWLNFVLVHVESSLRWLLALGLAWMLVPFIALAFTSIAERLHPDSWR